MNVANTRSGGGQPQRSPSKAGQGSGGGMLLELVDRILDKGIVIDIWARVSILSIETLTIEARAVVASVETYQQWANAMAATALASAPAQRSSVVEAAPSQPQFEPMQQPMQQPQQAQPQQAQPQQAQPQPQQAQQSPGGQT